MIKKAFSLAEMMVVMLILSIVLAAATPIITKRVIAEQNQETRGSSVPIGTIIIWSSTTLPGDDDLGKWLECNGQSTAGFPELAAVIGPNVPDYRNQFLEGNSTPNIKITAGLPNITGMSARVTVDSISFLNENMGALYYDYEYDEALRGGAREESHVALKFDASRSNPIYGNSITVQPPATTVRYLIKASR